MTHPHQHAHAGGGGSLGDALRLVFWELTARCNLKCKHCRAEAQEEAVVGELTTEEIFTLAEDIRATGDPIIILSGGEPLMRPDFFPIAEKCCNLFSRVALATNGTFVDDALAQRLAATGIQRISVSLDGAKAATHDTFRGQQGSFAAAMEGCRAIRRAGISLQINVTITKFNEIELPDLLQITRELGGDALHIFMLVPVGCGLELMDDGRLSPERYEEVLSWLYDQSLELRGQLHIKATCAPQYYRIMRQVSRDRGVALPGNEGGMQAMTRGCLAGSAVCFISRLGDVQPCGYLPLIAGNVRREPFGTIWRESELFNSLRDADNLGGKCGACAFRKVCMGCRARAYAVHNDYLAEEPDCAYVPPKLESGVGR